MLGMPAFNQSKKLIGFYRSEQGADKITRTVFKNVPVTVTQSDRDDASGRLENAIADMNSSSHNSSSCSSSSDDSFRRQQGPLFVLSEWHNNLDEMKDDAMICYMIKEDEANASREQEQQRTADGVYDDDEEEEDGDDDDDGDGDGDEVVH